MEIINMGDKINKDLVSEIFYAALKAVDPYNGCSP
jgi:hypothetical protein